MTPAAVGFIAFETQVDIATAILQMISKETLQSLVSAPHDALNA
jgi:hypothetical protein